MTHKHVPRGMIEAPFPVRPGLIARVTIPEDLTSDEAARLARFIMTFAVDADFASVPAVSGDPE
jgi:hypothetical protein